MSVLHILDCSAYLHVGGVNEYLRIQLESVKTREGYFAPYIPTGGVAYLLNAISGFIDRREQFVVVCDREPTYKRSIYPDYKAGSAHTRKHCIQMQVVEDILEDCGISVMWSEGHEADPIIAMLATYYSKESTEYDEIVVHTDDSDLFACVNPKVRVEGVSGSSAGAGARSKARHKIVTYANFETTCKAGRLIPYNMISIDKVIKGEGSFSKGDNIPALGKADMSIADMCIRMMREPDQWGFDYAEEILSDIMGLQDCPFKRNMMLVYPEKIRDVDPTDICTFPDSDKLAQWGGLVQASAWRRRAVKPTDHVWEIVQSWIDKQLVLGAP